MDSLLLEPTGAYLRYEDVPGDEEPIVWLHGLGCAASADFAHVAAHPSLRGHRSLLIDLLGHGYSDAPKDFGYALEDHARTVAALMDHLGLSHSPVFGHSMGGSVAITMAAERPDLVSSRKETWIRAADGSARGSPARARRSSWPPGTRRSSTGFLAWDG